MKRVLDPSVSPVQKMLKSIQGSSSDDFKDNHDVFPLLDLHNDELKYVLRYLHLDDKKNMKLVAKECEKRVMSIDPDLRKWTVEFTDENYIEQKLGLTKAKLKHMKDGDLHHIQLNLDFTKYNENGFDYSFGDLVLTESVICEWKNNIINLKMFVSGYEFYFLGSDKKLPKLQSLELWQSKCEGMPDIKEDDHLTAIAKQNISSVISALMKNDSIEDLSFTDISVTVLEKIYIKKFSVSGNVPPKVIASVLESSHQTIELLHLNYLCDNDDAFEIDIIPVKLKKLDSDETPLRVVVNIMKCLSSTLEEMIAIFPTDEEFDFEFGINELRLKKMELYSVTVEVLQKLVKSSKSSLEYLEICGLYESENIQSEVIILPSLMEFYSNNVSEKIIHQLIQGSYSTLESLCFIDDDNSFPNENVDVEIRKYSSSQMTCNGVVNLIRSAVSNPELSDLTEAVLLMLNNHSIN